MIFFRSSKSEGLPMGLDIITVNVIFLELIRFYLQQTLMASCCKEIKKKRNFQVCQIDEESAVLT